MRICTLCKNIYQTHYHSAYEKKRMKSRENKTKRTTQEKGLTYIDDDDVLWIQENYLLNSVAEERRREGRRIKRER